MAWRSACVGASSPHLSERPGESMVVSLLLSSAEAFWGRGKVRRGAMRQARVVLGVVHADQVQEGGQGWWQRMLPDPIPLSGL